MSLGISVSDLSKTYRIPVRNPGLKSALKSVFSPEYKEVMAVDRISFRIEPGEVVGFIGPNGAGKTTTLKMLSGLMHPTSGDIRAGGFKPWERKPEYLKRISMLMGNKSQLTWDNTVLDSLEILRDIYHVAGDDYKSRLEELVSLLEIEELLNKLARNLSLGERARCEFAASLLHSPDLVFLDEPTLGLDVSMQLKLRNFIREYNRKRGTTIILTSHYMYDISSLCERVILIHEGRILFDGALGELASRMAPYKLVKVSLSPETDIAAVNEELGRLGDIIECDNLSLTVRVGKDDVLKVTDHIIRNFRLSDLTLEDPPIEAVIDKVYREGMGA